MNERPVVLDASALLALLLREPGGERVFAALPSASMSAVNLAEVASKLVDRGMPAHEVRSVLEAVDLDLQSFDPASAYDVGELRRTTRKTGLSIGDRACLALAAKLGAVALTADRAWRDVLPGAEIEFIR